MIEKVNTSQKFNPCEFFTLSLAKRRNKNLFDKLDLNKLYADSLEYIDKIWKKRFVLNDNQKQECLGKNEVS